MQSNEKGMREPVNAFPTTRENMMFKRPTKNSHAINAFHKYNRATDSMGMILFPMISEFFGTMVFLFIVYGSWFQMQYWGISGAVGPLEGPIVNPITTNILNSLAFFFGFTLSASAFIDVSGAHFNPVVTLATTLLGGTSLFKFILYAFAQIAGAIVANIIVYGFIPVGDRTLVSPDLTTLLFSTTVNPTFGYVKALGMEIMLSFILVLVWLRYTHFHNLLYDPRCPKVPHTAPLVIAMTYAGCELVGLGISGASMNPARSFAPFVFTGFVTGSYQWIYWVGPTVGTVGAVVVSAMFEWFICDGYHSVQRGMDIFNIMKNAVFSGDTEFAAVGAAKVKFDDPKITEKLEIQVTGLSGEVGGVMGVMNGGN